MGWPGKCKAHKIATSEVHQLCRQLIGISKVHFGTMHVDDYFFIPCLGKFEVYYIYISLQFSAKGSLDSLVYR
ncbi:hypothetical protein SAMN05878282_10986 [Aquipseudomonas alcaligenes]|uniref:Uncharacterized protein n=1 Tax=Aquipseudomonas alcaligenes TaxID=43263 RepID=A0A1N6WAG6_AQUAC|nr:hypothetical protein SAMN05878282_10986 [Pseudomonas alcaligenes]